MIERTGPVPLIDVELATGEEARFEFEMSMIFPSVFPFYEKAVALICDEIGTDYDDDEEDNDDD